MRFFSIPAATWASATALLLPACANVTPTRQLQAACPALAGRTTATALIGLPSGSATIDAAVLVPASNAVVGAGGGSPPSPEYCKVLGSIAPTDARAQRIHFELNLPTAWNGKLLQYGGGGFNGSLVTGLAALRDASPTDPLPLARGYATLGTDSGHQAAAWAPSEPGAFALNDEMLENFAFASYKKVRDVSVDIARAFYDRKPSRIYYFGGSEGGREGLTMAQRFPADYDGIVSIAPVINWTGLFHAFVRNELPQFDHWLRAAKVPLISKATSDACDALDGLADGVIDDYLACQSRVDLRLVRCPGGADAGDDCLSQADIDVLAAIHSPYVFPFALANGVTSYPQWLYGHEDALDGPSALNLVRWVTGSAAPTVPPTAATNATQWLYGSNWIRYAIARDANFDVRGYSPGRFLSRVQQTSALIDSTNPDLSAFFAHGGKLILRENGADRAQSPLMGIRYVESAVARLGASAVEASVRLYVSPASTHTGNSRTTTTHEPIATQVDLLDPLDRWVTLGHAPPSPLVQTVMSASAPFVVKASRPLCRYPAYPRYTGGDKSSAASFTCRPAQP